MDGILYWFDRAELWFGRVEAVVQGAVAILIVLGVGYWLLGLLWQNWDRIWDAIFTVIGWTLGVIFSTLAAIAGAFLLEWLLGRLFGPAFWHLPSSAIAMAVIYVWGWWQVILSRRPIPDHYYN